MSLSENLGSLLRRRKVEPSRCAPRCSPPRNAVLDCWYVSRSPIAESCCSTSPSFWRSASRIVRTCSTEGTVPLTRPDASRSGSAREDSTERSLDSEERRNSSTLPPGPCCMGTLAICKYDLSSRRSRRALLPYISSRARVSGGKYIGACAARMGGQPLGEGGGLV